jgi:hypothetical protein
VLPTCHLGCTQGRHAGRRASNADPANPCLGAGGGGREFDDGEDCCNAWSGLLVTDVGPVATANRHRAHGVLRKVVAQLELCIAKRAAAKAKIPSYDQELATVRDLFQTSQQLEPRPRGYALEKIFNTLMRISKVPVESPFSLKGEQLDGAKTSDRPPVMVLPAAVDNAGCGSVRSSAARLSFLSWKEPGCSQRRPGIDGQLLGGAEGVRSESAGVVHCAQGCVWLLRTARRGESQHIAGEAVRSRGARTARLRGGVAGVERNLEETRRPADMQIVSANMTLFRNRQNLSRCKTMAIQPAIRVGVFPTHGLAGFSL